MASHHLAARVGHVEVKCLVERVAQADIRNVPMNRGGHCFFVSLFNSTNIGWDRRMDKNALVLLGRCSLLYCTQDN